jgi:hypothetical protein
MNFSPALSLFLLMKMNKARIKYSMPSLWKHLLMYFDTVTIKISTGEKKGYEVSEKYHSRKLTLRGRIWKWNKELDVLIQR